MIGQALTNLIKNAGEAIESHQKNGAEDDFVPTIHVSCIPEDDYALIQISDNGVGLPEDRSSLFEPYVTTRDSGTGLGLPIVKKIVEEHGGTLTLEDAPLMGNRAQPGAMASIRIPLAVDEIEENEKQDLE